MGVYNVRGTHGSGKSFIVHQLLKEEHQPIIVERKLLGYYIPEYKCAVVGRYNRICGGCDGIKTASEVVDRVRLFNWLYKHVIFEGILVSHTFERYHQLAQEIKDFHFLFLDTPLELCIRRVLDRREQKGNERALDPKNVIKDWHGIRERVYPKCVKSGCNVAWINHLDPLLQIKEYLR